MKATMDNKYIDGDDEFMDKREHEHSTGHSRMMMVWC